MATGGRTVPRGLSREAFTSRDVNRTYAEWQTTLGDLEQSLAAEPANLDLANRYWRELTGHPGFDYRSGDRALRIFRKPAIASPQGAVALAAAVRELAEETGEFPEPTAFDPQLREALSGAIATPSIDRDILRWLSNQIDMRGSEQGR